MEYLRMYIFDQLFAAYLEHERPALIAKQLAVIPDFYLIFIKPIITNISSN